MNFDRFIITITPLMATRFRWNSSAKTPPIFPHNFLFSLQIVLISFQIKSGMFLKSAMVEPAIIWNCWDGNILQWKRRWFSGRLRRLEILDQLPRTIVISEKHSGGNSFTGQESFKVAARSSIIHHRSINVHSAQFQSEICPKTQTKSQSSSDFSGNNRPFPWRSPHAVAPPADRWRAAPLQSALTRPTASLSSTPVGRRINRSNHHRHGKLDNICRVESSIFRPTDFSARATDISPEM